MLVRDVMTTEPVCVEPEATIQVAAGQMREMRVGFLPVCDNDKLVGSITDRDIAIRTAADGADPKKTQVKEVMTENVEYCFDDQELEEVSQSFTNKRIRRLPVLNRDKRLIGVCSIGDIAAKHEDKSLSGRMLSEISKPATPRR